MQSFSGDSDCFKEGFKQLGNIVHPNIDNVASAADCQIHCQNIDACTFFLYITDLQSCRFKEFPNMVADPKAISGPKYC